MPVQRILPEPPPIHLELVDELANELRARQAEGPEDAPFIIERVLPRSDYFEVTVVWDRWTGVPLQERSVTIMDAYRQVSGIEGMTKITAALGLTREEAARRGLLSSA